MQSKLITVIEQVKSKAACTHFKIVFVFQFKIDHKRASVGENTSSYLEGQVAGKY